MAIDLDPLLSEFKVWNQKRANRFHNQGLNSVCRHPVDFTFEKTGQVKEIWQGLEELEISTRKKGLKNLKMLSQVEYVKKK